MPRVIENPRTGERIVIRQSSADTDGRLLAFDLCLPPGAHVPAAHAHPRQEERFTVLAGCIRFRRGRESLVARPGASITVSSGTPHWFGNAGPEVAHVRVEVRPALRMEALLAATAQPSTHKRWWSRLIDLALIPFDFQSEVGVPHVPPRLITALLLPLAWLRPRLSA